MTLKAEQRFFDLKSGTVRECGDIFDVPDDRAAELEQSGFVSRIEEKKQAKGGRKPKK